MLPVANADGEREKSEKLSLVTSGGQRITSKESAEENVNGGKRGKSGKKRNERQAGDRS